MHFIVPAGGITKCGQWKSSKQQGDFLFNVEHLSRKFSARFVKKLRQLKQQGKITRYVPRDLIKKPWVVYAKQAFGSPESVVEYLGRYTHRVAISNTRILNVTDQQVTFRWCNGKKGYKSETETIPGEVFLNRFLDHIVPYGFRRIRHLGFLSSRNKRAALASIRKDLQVCHSEMPRLSRAEVLTLRFGNRSVLRCNLCNGELMILQIFKKYCAPPAFECA